MTTTIMFLIILGIIAAGVLAAAFVPITFAAEIHVSPAGKIGIMSMQWIHPWVARWEYDVEQRRSETIILGRTRIVKGDGTKSSIYNEQAHIAAVPLAKEEPHAPRETPWISDNHKTAYTLTESFIKERPVNPIARGWKKMKMILSLLKNNRRAIVKVLLWCRRTLRFCFLTVRVHRFRLHARVGAGNPAETGKMYGWYTVLNSSIFSLYKNIEVRFTPEFSGEQFECDGSIALRSSFARIAMPLIVALATFPYLTSYFVWRRVRKMKSLSNY
jgi:hypothetical protein